MKYQVEYNNVYSVKRYYRIQVLSMTPCKLTRGYQCFGELVPCIFMSGESGRQQFSQPLVTVYSVINSKAHVNL
jgi:hypothetical protein